MTVSIAEGYTVHDNIVVEKININISFHTPTNIRQQATIQYSGLNKENDNNNEGRGIDDPPTHLIKRQAK